MTVQCILTSMTKNIPVFDSIGKAARPYSSVEAEVWVEPVDNEKLKARISERIAQLTAKDIELPPELQALHDLEVKKS